MNVYIDVKTVKMATVRNSRSNLSAGRPFIVPSMFSSVMAIMMDSSW